MHANTRLIVSPLTPSLSSRRPQTSPNRTERLFKLSSHYALDGSTSLPSPLRQPIPYSYCIAGARIGIRDRPIKAPRISSRFRSPIRTPLDTLILHIGVPLRRRVQMGTRTLPRSFFPLRRRVASPQRSARSLTWLAFWVIQLPRRNERQTDSRREEGERERGREEGRRLLCGR